MIRAMRSILVLCILATLGARGLSTTAQEFPLAIPPVGIQSEPLFEATFPAEAIPEENPRIFFVRLRYYAGESFDWPAVPAAEYVLSGSLAVRSEGRLGVQRADAVEDIPPGAAATIAAGEVVLYRDDDAETTRASVTTTTTIAVLVVSLGETRRMIPRGLSTYIMGHLSTYDWKQSDLPVGPLRVRVERLTVPMDTALPAPVETLPVLRFIDAGELAWTIQSPAELLAPASGFIFFGRGQAVPYQRLPAGHRLLLHSSGDEPLVLLVLRVTPE